MSSSDCQVVSLREAARRLGLPLTSFRRIAQAEPRLQACIQPGRPAKVDLKRLLITWRQLEQADNRSLSPRQELALERRKRLWWQSRSLLLQLQEEERKFCNAEQIQNAEKEVFALLEKLMKSWAQSIAPQLLESRDAYGLMLSSINSTLQAASDQAQRNADVYQETERPVQLAMPPELPSLEVLQADIERARGGLHRLRAQQAAGEVVLVTDVTSKQFDRCRRVRDQFLALAPRLSGVAIGWRTISEAKTELITGVSTVLAAW
ncbi:hypothetical protein [Prochlorococcus sp. MIT 1201]|uniref:hypothetical protein n=1 Tax=Prochlorococcus sp. MIT 1201 TaxID=3082535 RepID=UPI0039A76BAA